MAGVRIDVLTLFPKICEGAFSESMIGRAQDRGLARIAAHNIRNWARDKHHVTDEPPYGGGQGMVMKAEPIFEAVESLRTPETKVLLMSPAGQQLQQSLAASYAEKAGHLIIICGHYEGVDQRVIDHLVDAEISIGDYVLTNGALAAAVFVDAVVRLLPGVLGDQNSAAEDSFSDGLLEFPHYTRPLEYRGWRVPEVLLTGNHAAIAKWRADQAKARTAERRPDLLEKPISS